MKANLVDVCIDIGGSGTKISASLEQSEKLSPPVRFPNQNLFNSKQKAGERVAKAIIQVIDHYFPKSAISLIAISMTGIIDHNKNLLILSDRLEQCEKTGNPYKTFDLAQAIKIALKDITKRDIKVVLVHDRISAALDPSYNDKLVLTLILGTYPVIGLTEKAVNTTNIYDDFIGSWVDSIILSTGHSITQELNTENMKKRDDLCNCKFIEQSIVKILAKYKEVFHWQPNLMVILGGWATILQHLTQTPKQIKPVKIITVTDHGESVKSQMNGALYFAKNSAKFLFK